MAAQMIKTTPHNVMWHWAYHHICNHCDNHKI